jgi:hypothetical protein
MFSPPSGVLRALRAAGDRRVGPAGDDHEAVAQ